MIIFLWCAWCSFLLLIYPHLDVDEKKNYIIHLWYLLARGLAVKGIMEFQDEALLSIKIALNFNIIQPSLLISLLTVCCVWVIFLQFLQLRSIICDIIIECWFKGHKNAVSVNRHMSFYRLTLKIFPFASWSCRNGIHDFTWRFDTKALYFIKLIYFVILVLKVETNDFTNFLFAK